MNPRWVTWFSRVVWMGIAVNTAFVVPLVFFPAPLLRFLDLPVVEPLLWARTAGMLLFIISAFYVPAALDPERYRIVAWLHIFPSRTFGATFFFGAVLLFGHPAGYLSIAVVDAVFGLASLVLLLLAIRPERARKVAVTLGAAAVLAALLVGMGWYKLLREVPQALADDSPEEYFKYGSVGIEDENGMPYWIWVVLPRLFPEYLPGPGGYAAFGVPWEPGREMPVGFTKKTIGFERVAFNCALCHTASVRRSPADAVPVLYPAGPSHTFDALAYQRFLFACGSDPRFTASNILAEIDKMHRLSLLDRALYRVLLIPLTRRALIRQRDAYAWTNSRPDWGPGRIDPFNPVKASVLHRVRPDVGVGDTIGNSDMVPIWNMRARQGMALHWDGLNTDLTEVVLSSAIGDGATAKSIPLARLDRLQAWLVSLRPPEYPFAETIDRTLAERGRGIFTKQCAACHATGGARTGQVVPLAEVGTDPHRLHMWTKESAEAYNDYARRYPWRFTRFRKTDGYVSVPLDGVWIRGPYLHNGSVPSLTDLLEVPARRPAVFYRGYDVYDRERVGFVSLGPDAERYGMRYDTRQPGNSNQGHLWGTDLAPPDKRALIEHLKTL